MQTITLQIKNTGALNTLKDLEKRHFVKILEDSLSTSYALSGNKLSIKQFNQWVKMAEFLPTTSLKNAKNLWESRKKHLKSLID